MIYKIFGLSIKIILLQFCLGILQTEAQDSGKDIEIWPNLSSYVLTSETPEVNRFVVCQGNESVQWYYRQIDGNLLIKKNYSIKVFPTDQNKTTYLSFLSLSTATYLDTGYYICSTSKELKYFKEIYIFIHDGAHLLAIPEDFNFLYDSTEYNTVIGPFRPTSPDVNVQITTNTKRIDVPICDPTDIRCVDDVCVSPNQVCNKEICDPTYFRCSDGTCVLPDNICDQENHCADGSDEEEFMCKARPCSPKKPFECSNGICIFDKDVCNGYNNCKDGEDEDKAMCKARPCSPEIPFKCNNSQCIYSHYVCDGFNDCEDGDDEDEAVCKDKPCSPEVPFRCKHGICIRDDDVCNGVNDCKDDSDEDEAMCKARPCSSKRPFKCNNGICISNDYVCDGNKHCKDGNDEDETRCNKTRTCDPKTEFKCTNGQCIKSYMVCGGIYNCIDGSDEEILMCKVTRYTKFDQKIGFLMDVSIFFDLNINIACTASKNNIIENRLIRNPLKSWLHINDSSEGHAIIGQNLTLKCFFEYKISSIYIIKWATIGKSENEIRHIQFKTKKYSNESAILDVVNVTADDEGDYICIARTLNGRNYTKKYALRVFPYDVNYFNLRIDDVHKKIRPVGHESVQWKVRISPIQNTSIEWLGPNGKRLETRSKMTCVDNNNRCLSEFIVKNVQASDSGAYTLAAHNGVQSKEIEVTLLVEEKPSLSFINVLDSNLPYYVIGKNYSFEFYISGYPLPNVTWTFEKCSSYPMCERSDAETEEIKNKTIHTSARTLKLVITMNITDTGTLICNASNILGYFSKKYTILATDISNNIEVKGTSIALPGDTVNIQCGASKYHYQNDIIWNYTGDNITQSYFNINHSETRFSYLSHLLIKNISKDFNGNMVNCTVKRTTQSNGVLPETKSLIIKVKDSSVPVINNSSNTVTSIVVCYDKQLDLSCFASGVPPPTISWFKNDKPLQYDENNSRVLVDNENELLRVQITEIESNTTYKCKALNKVGSAILTYTFTHDYKRHENKMFSILVFCIIVLILYLGILIKCVSNFLNRKKTTKKILTLIDVAKIEKDTVKSDDPNFKNKVYKYTSDKRLSFSNDKLELGKLLGSGAFGLVFKANAIGILDENVTTKVAVKTITPDSDSYCVRTLESELKMMIRIGCHLNIVNLLGVCTETVDERLMVILEYCRFGSIYQYLLNNREHFVNQFTQDGFIDHDNQSKSENPIYETLNLCCTYDLLCWSYQVARGMEYLASKKIIHCDLATRNILLAERNIVKICDFGLSKSLNDSDIYKKNSKKGLFPVKWMAIESIRELVFSTKTDVWSFGIVLWEMFSLASIPYPDLQCHELEDKLSNGYRLEQPQYADSQMYNIMLDCWKAEPIVRPSFTDLRDRLDNKLQDFTKTDYFKANYNYEGTIDETLSPCRATEPMHLHCTTTIETHEQSNKSISSHCSVDIE